MTITIRPMERGDIPAVAELENEIYDQPWSPRVFFDELAMGNRRYLVASSKGGMILGYSGLLIVEDDAHITTIAVAEQSRGTHLGTRLMLALVDVARDADTRHLTLEVRVSNDGAQRLYERFGFDPVGRRKNYYKDEDALVMWATDIDNDAYQERIAEIRAAIEDATT
ncbi:MAG: ribosomal protein S18-alanine N-acetyltransferase [Actinomycetia bacterium]|nr:ribosomal protein S18-alanine N-acetyltransferase [Actinomycetes bacterium]